MSLKLSREQRDRLLAGDYRPLIFDTKPYELEQGSEYVFAWSRPRPYVDPETKSVLRPPAEPVAWLTVRRIIRRVDDWVVMFDVTDRRHLSLMLARGGGYTTDHRFSIDRAEAVLSEDDQRRFQTEAKAMRAQLKENDLEDRRRQERAVRSRLREVLGELDPQGQQALLAQIEQLIEASKAERDAA